MDMNHTPTCCLRALPGWISPVAAGLCFALIALAAPQASAQAAPESATLRLDWLPSGYHTPFFLALERGYYRSAGVDLQIFDGKGSFTTVQAVAAGTDTFGLASLPTMAIGAARGMPLVAVAGLIQKNPDSVISLRDAGISKPKDLEGKRGAFVPTSAGDRIFPAFAKATGIDMDKITKLQMDSAARHPTLLQGNADFVIGWSFSDAYRINRQKPIAPPMLFADHGLTMLSTGVIVGKDTLAKRGNLVKGFLAATVKGLDEMLQSPEAAVDVTMRQRPGADRDALLYVAKALGGFMRTENSAGKPPGWMAKEDWAESRRLLVTYLEMSDAVATEALFSNDYLPADGRK